MNAVHPARLATHLIETVPVVSVVVPLHDEALNIAPLATRILDILDGQAFELILVDDGSRDATRAEILGLARQDRRIRVLVHDRAAGQSAAVHSGARAARGRIVVTLDGDGQNPPVNIPALIAPLMTPRRDPALALVAGQRVGRRDTMGRRLASRFANGLRGWLLGDRTRDTGCGLKAFDRAAYLALPYFNHQHRFLPALFLRDGWQVAHVEVTHAPRLAGRSKYTNLGRALVGITDLAGVAWLIRRRKRETPREITPEAGA